MCTDSAIAKSMTGEDKRGDRTKEALKKAFLRCLDEMPYDKVHVSTIAATAGVSRKTFYYHFMDKTDLVKWICFTDIQEFAQEHCANGPTAFAEMLRFFIDRNRVLYGHALQDMSTGSFGQFFSDVLFDLINKRFRGFFPVDEKSQRIAKWAIALEAEKARLLTIVLLLDPEQHSADDLIDYIYVSESVFTRVIIRWINNVKNEPRFAAYHIEDFTENEFATKRIHDFTLDDLLVKALNNNGEIAIAEERGSLERLIGRYRN